MLKKKNGKRDSKATRKSRPSRSSSNSGAFQLDPAHSEKIASLKPHLFEAVHQVLRSNGVDAVVHSISFRPANAVVRTYGPCGSQPCCYINGVWTCW